VRKCVWRIKCVFAGNAYGCSGGPGGGVDFSQHWAQGGM
jgi:hypothetical protein